jgi:hypothetical protein
MHQHHLRVVLPVALFAWLPACASHGTMPRDLAEPPGATLHGASIDGAAFDRALAAAARTAPAPAIRPAEGDRTGAVGLGMTFDPDALAIGGSADFYQSERMAIGPDLLLSTDANTDILAGSFHGKFVFPIQGNDSPLWMPFVKGGAGVAYFDRDGDSAEFGFQLNIGGGVEVRFDDRYAFGSEVLWFLLPDELVGEGAFVSWQIAQFCFRF